MKLNEDVALLTDKLVLVPYEPHHVPKYHSWMQSSELLEQTASEPLPLDQEYEMQQSWREDNDKLTFILLQREPLAELIAQPEPVGREHEIAAMIGDVNLFLNDPDDEHCGELEVRTFQVGQSAGSSELWGVKTLRRPKPSTA
eukprot:m.57284 g.57284  ORF g.57284 m.57284 type:complete len:143 (+) comp13716_c0_seq3:2-430(+)